MAATSGPCPAHRTLPPEAVRVYRNLRYAATTWSVMDRRSGLVVAHRPVLELRAVRFTVRPGGHTRAVRTGVRNVHAFVEGVLYGGDIDWDDPDPGASGGWRSARYEPFGAPWFFDATSGAPLWCAAAARVDDTGLHYVACGS